jgi:hypothetical protein
MSDVAYLRDQAEQCRRLARDQSNESAVRTLKDMARQYDDLADAVEADSDRQPPIRRPLLDP